YGLNTHSLITCFKPIRQWFIIICFANRENVMIRIVFIVSFYLLLSACQPSVVKDSTSGSDLNDFKVYDTEVFFDTPSLFGSSLNFDGSSVLVSSNETGIYNAFRVP